MNNNKKQQQPVLPFVIHSATSEDPDYPSSELLNGSSGSKGWQTQRLNSFPQSLIVRFPQKSHLQSLQYLSHQCKISSKVEVHIALAGETSQNPVFKKLGYFTLSNNENSNFQSRELKTVYVDCPAQFVKFVFLAPYANSLNFFNQVGVIALSFFGNSLFTGQSEPSPYGVRQQMGSSQPQAKTSIDKQANEIIDNLESQKRKAVENEDYSKAKEIKEKIQRIRENSDEITRLERKKRGLVEQEDFEGAEIVKRDIERLTSLILSEEEIFRGREPPNNRDYQNQPREVHSQNKQDYQDISGKRGQAPSRNVERQVAKNDPESFGPDKRRQNPNPNFIDDVDQLGGKSSNKGGEIRQQKMINEGDKYQGFGTKALENEGMQQGETHGDEEDDQDIESSLLPKYQPKLSGLSQFFQISFLHTALSSTVQHRISAIDSLLIEVEKLKNPQFRKNQGSFFTGNDRPEIVFSCWKLCALFLEERVTQVFQKACRLASLLADLFADKSIYNFLKHSSGFSQVVDQIVEFVIDRAKDYKNSSVMDFIEFLSDKLCGYKLLNIEEFAERLIGFKQSPPLKNATGRFILVQKLLKNYGESLSKIFPKLVSVSVENLENPNSSVREESISLIKEIYKMAGEISVSKMLDSAKIRKNHREMLQRLFDELRENEVNDEEEDEIEEEQEEDNSEHNNSHNSNRINDDQNEDGEVPKNECEFCGWIDNAFLNQDQLDIHMFKFCPVLMVCPECQQVIEIKDRNDHLLSECKNCDDFSQCNRCLSAIPNDEFQTHTSRMSCKLQRPDQKNPRCPLCLADLIANQRGSNFALRDHLVSGECPRNQRTLKEN
jgi:centrosomal protein CEP104